MERMYCLFINGCSIFRPNGLTRICYPFQLPLRVLVCCCIYTLRRVKFEESVIDWNEWSLINKIKAKAKRTCFVSKYLTQSLASMEIHIPISFLTPFFSAGMDRIQMKYTWVYSTALLWIYHGLDEIDLSPFNYPTWVHFGFQQTTLIIRYTLE